MISIAASKSRDDVAPDVPEQSSRAAAAWRDLAAGAARSWMWTALALQDIKLRYRGSVLGPFWLTISTVIMVAAMGAIYSRLFGMELTTYLPYLTIGLIVWQFVSAVVTEGCGTFLQVESVIQQIPIPFSIHAYRGVCRNLIVLAHSFVIIPVVLLVFPQPLDWHVLESVLGLALLTVNSLWISILLGMVSTRFRDIPPIVASFLQVLFFVTPVFWPLEAAGQWKPILELNPGFAAIDVIRAPLLGQPVTPSSWIILILATLLGSAVTFALFARFRTRIAYWI
jgi:ABC-type polysaccharide/polyol phosphate export permease